MYEYYSPQQGRDEALARLQALSARRQRFTDEMFARQEQERMRMQREQEQANMDSLNTWYGNAGQGAMAGAMFGPVGAGIGAGAGVLLGIAAEAKNRQGYQRGVKGNGGYSMWDGVKDSVLRAPSVREVAPLLGGVGAAGATLMARRQTAAGAGEQPLPTPQTYVPEAQRPTWDNMPTYGGTAGVQGGGGYAPMGYGALEFGGAAQGYIPPAAPKPLPPMTEGPSKAFMMY